jgi:hypothetical protein
VGAEKKFMIAVVGGGVGAEKNLSLQYNDSLKNLLVYVIQGVPLATETGISLIILTPMKILQRNRHTLQTHSSSFLTQRKYCCLNFVAMSSLVIEILKQCRIW